MNRGRILLLLTVGLTACNARAPQDWPAQGTIAAPAEGAAGYQHGPEHTRFVVGDHARQESKYGYLKSVGDQGTLATNHANGSTFAVPSAHAESLGLPPYGKSPEEHDAYVKEYFLKLGLPADQLAGVRGMTLVEAHGPAREVGRTPGQVTAYYSALQRTVAGVPVADSFAWARVNARSEVVQEGVYWPALPANVVQEVRQFREMLADPQRLASFNARLPVPGASGAVVIRHSAATSDEPFEAFAGFDVVVHSSQPSLQKAAVPATSVSVIRHFDINGRERFLPQERLDLGARYPVDKKPADRLAAQ